jgi:hypothetical protein
MGADIIVKRLPELAALVRIAFGLRKLRQQVPVLVMIGFEFLIDRGHGSISLTKLRNERLTGPSVPI